MKQFLLFLFLGVIGFTFISGYAGTEEFSSAGDSDACLDFIEKCSKCHDIGRATEALKKMNEGEFHKLIVRMSNKANSGIDQESQKEIEKFRRAKYKKR